jgi:hypothetical protein
MSPSSVLWPDHNARSGGTLAVPAVGRWCGMITGTAVASAQHSPSNFGRRHHSGHDRLRSSLQEEDSSRRPDLRNGAQNPMIRVALALYLMLASAAGPWLCCCTGVRLLGCEAPPSGDDGGSTPCTCGRHGQQNRAPQVPDEPQPDKPCPCQDDRAAAPAIVTPPVSEDGRDRPLTSFLAAEPRAPAACFVSQLLKAAGLDSISDLSAFPLGGRGILCALQILRC